MAKATSLVITAHGHLDRSGATRTLPYTLITGCKFGEIHAPKHLTFSDLSIFLNPLSLRDYILQGKDYTDKGEVVVPGVTIPNISLSPLVPTDIAKAWSWQRPNVAAHLGKLCAYELRDIPSNPCGVNYLNIGTYTLYTIKTHAATLRHFSLITHVDMAELYIANSQYMHQISIDPTHICSATNTTSGCYIFDYEVGPTSFGLGASDHWGFVDAITGVTNYLANSGVDLTGLDSVYLKSCLS